MTIVAVAMLTGGAWKVWKMQNQLTPSNGLLTSPGAFSSPDGRFKLEVTIDPQHVVQYKVTEAGADKPSVEANAGSAYSRWYFAWGGKGKVWVHSSDIGMSLWVLESGKAHKVDLQPGIPELSEMPATFRQQLPGGVRVRFGL